MSHPVADATGLVTGGSSGIGDELARLLAADGAALLLVARRRDDLEAAAGELRIDYGVDTHVFPQDLAERNGTHARYDAVTAAGHEVDPLVNNAGFGVYGPFRDGDLATDHDTITLHVSTVTTLTKRFGRAMVARGEGYIPNVAAIGGLVPVLTSAGYSSAKHYGRAISEPLANEFADTGVTVTAPCPDPTDTAFFDRGGFDAAGFTDAEKLSAATVARAGYEGPFDGDRLVIPGIRNRLVDQLANVLPRRWIVAAAKRARTE